MDLQMGGLGYWSLFYQLETMVNIGNTSDDQADLYNGALLTLGIEKETRKGALKSIGLNLT